jgi:hypothetical protein
MSVKEPFPPAAAATPVPPRPQGPAHEPPSAEAPREIPFEEPLRAAMLLSDEEFEEMVAYRKLEKRVGDVYPRLPARGNTQPRHPVDD